MVTLAAPPEAAKRERREAKRVCPDCGSDCANEAACEAYQSWRYSSGLLTWATQLERRAKLARHVLQALETLESDTDARVRVKQYQMAGILSCAPYARICVRGELKRLAWTIVRYGDDSRFDTYELFVAEVVEGWVKPV